MPNNRNNKEIANEKELNWVFKKYSREYSDNFMHSRGGGC